MKRRILHNGAGNKKTSGVSYGWSFHQLLRVVSNLLNTSARPNVKDVASVTSLVLAAQQCAAVPVQMINAQCSVSPDSDFIGRFIILDRQ